MTLDRRSFLELLGGSLAITPLTTLAKPPSEQLLRAGKRRTQPLGKARNLVFIVMQGGPSHVDTFDLKLGSWTPDRLGPGRIHGAFDWPMGTMPKLAARADRFSLVRSINAFETVHPRGRYHLFTSYPQDPKLEARIPHYASNLSYALRDEPKDGGFPFAFTSFIHGKVGNGLLKRRYRMTPIDAESKITNIRHHWFQALEQNQGMMNYIPLQDYQTGDDRREYHEIRKQALAMSRQDKSWLLAHRNTRVGPLNNIYAQIYLEQADMVVRLLSNSMGTRVFELNFNGWDHHIDIYNERAGLNLFNLSYGFDEAVTHLLDRLEETPSQHEGYETLLDETLIVAMGEFGRTVGDLTQNGGRDHYPYVTPAFFAGGGIKGGRVIGASSNDGAYITDQGWSHNRPIYINDIVATLYSAMGVDWNQTIYDPILKRQFELVDTSRIGGPAYHLEELFS